MIKFILILMMVACNVGCASNIELRTFDKVNLYRSSHGLTKLTLDPSISKIAREHSKQMSDKLIPFGHANFNKRTKRIPFKTIAENVAWNTDKDNADDVAIADWLKSSLHLKNIVGNYTTTGIGIVQTQNGTYFTQIFVSK
jgi:uncharacterized protein YkwD